MSTHQNSLWGMVLFTFLCIYTGSQSSYYCISWASVGSCRANGTEEVLQWWYLAGTLSGWYWKLSRFRYVNGLFHFAYSHL